MKRISDCVKLLVDLCRNNRRPSLPEREFERVAKVIELVVSYPGLTHYYTRQLDICYVEDRQLYGYAIRGCESCTLDYDEIVAVGFMNAAASADELAAFALSPASVSYFADYLVECMIDSTRPSWWTAVDAEAERLYSTLPSAEGRDV